MVFDYSALIGAGGSVNLVHDSVGQYISPDSMQKTITLDAQGRVSTQAVTDGVNTWVQTLSYPDDLTTTISQWVQQ